MLNLLFETRFVDARTIVLFGLVLLIACGSTNLDRSGNSQTVETNALAPSPVAQEKDDVLANKLSALYDAKNCVGFFDAFPTSFSEFERLYGFSDQMGAAPLYSKYGGHLQYFFRCPGISVRARIEKIYGIGMGGRWDADAPAMMQEACYQLIRENPREAKEILDRMPEKRASSFWYFVLDGPHPKDKATLEKVNVLRNALRTETKQSRLLLAQYQELLRNPRSH